MRFLAERPCCLFP